MCRAFLHLTSKETGSAAHPSDTWLAAWRWEGRSLNPAGEVAYVRPNPGYLRCPCSSCWQTLPLLPLPWSPRGSGLQPAVAKCGGSATMRRLMRLTSIALLLPSIAPRSSTAERRSPQVFLHFVLLYALRSTF